MLILAVIRSLIGSYDSGKQHYQAFSLTNPKQSPTCDESTF